MMTDAVVVGAGPNGLAAAVTLAQAGLEVALFEAADSIGGGTRTEELMEPGVLNDICAAVLPFGVASPFLRSLDLASHGLSWRWADVELAHPLPDGSAGVMLRSLDQTASLLGEDGPDWKRAFGRFVDGFEDLLPDLLGPILGVPDHPLRLARFGLGALQPATLYARRWKTDKARALWAGMAAHSFTPLGRPNTAATGLVLAAAGHVGGWPVAEGGTRAVSNALASMLLELGGRIETGVKVESLGDLPDARVTLLDVSPDAAVRITEDVMPARVRRSFRRWKFGPAAFKVDLVVEGHIPWANEACGRAGTVHCGGTLEEVVAAEAGLHRGRMPERPFVLVGQQYLADPTRSNGQRNPIWAYAHVPHGYSGDATQAVTSQIERFAPGFRDQIMATAVRSPPDFERYNANYVGGDISAGANSPTQLLFRPRLSLDPYRISERVFLCSSATPPGAGVHGMCGFHAARSAMNALGNAR